VDAESPSKSVRWPLLRVSPGSSVDVELLSGSWVRLLTHFCKRTVLCADCPECSLCELLPARPFWYLPAVIVDGRRPCLLELSAHASADLETVAKFAFGSVGPGLRVRLTRRSARAPLRSEALESVAAPARCRVHEWGTVLMAIFGLPPFREFEEVPAYGARVQRVVLERAAVMAARIKDSAKKSYS